MRDGIRCTGASWRQAARWTLLVPMLALPLPGPAQDDTLRVLAFSKTVGFRHDSIDTAHVVLRSLARRYRFDVVGSEDAADILGASLAAYDVIVFVNTTGDVLDASQQSALESYVTGGGGWVGVHSAADTEYDWPFYGSLLGNGAWFASHPSVQAAQLIREDGAHPASAHFVSAALVTDEWYNFRANPRIDVQVLLRLDEDSYAPGTGAMGADHPIAWAHPVGGGRAFYTGLGHRTETWMAPDFQRHLAAAVFWTAGRPFDYLLVDGFEP